MDVIIRYLIVYLVCYVTLSICLILKKEKLIYNGWFNDDNEFILKPISTIIIISAIPFVRIVLAINVLLMLFLEKD